MVGGLSRGSVPGHCHQKEEANTSCTQSIALLISGKSCHAQESGASRSLTWHAHAGCLHSLRTSSALHASLCTLCLHVPPFKHCNHYPSPALLLTFPIHLPTLRLKALHQRSEHKIRAKTSLPENQSHWISRPMPSAVSYIQESNPAANISLS